MKHKQLTKNFNSKEFDSPDKPFSGLEMDIMFVKKLQIVRNLTKLPLHVNSGFRTVEHNQSVGGKVNSSHLIGKAADLAFTSHQHLFSIIHAAISVGITRIGIGKNFIHLDDDKSKAQGVIWLY